MGKPGGGADGTRVTWKLSTILITLCTLFDSVNTASHTHATAT